VNAQLHPPRPVGPGSSTGPGAGSWTAVRRLLAVAAAAIPALLIPPPTSFPQAPPALAHLHPGPTPAGAQEPGFDYHPGTGEIVRNGRQALTICNGLFVSNRSLDAIYGAELARMGTPLPPSRVRIDEEAGTVAVGGDGDGPLMYAAHREGLGCIVLAPDQGPEDVEALPELTLPPPADDPDTIPWPRGDQVAEGPLPGDVDAGALEAAWEWAFHREAHGGHEGQETLSLLVVHRGEIVLERYAPGFDHTTMTRTWSAAKSLASTLVGIAVDRGLLELDAPLRFSWPPDELNEYRRRYAADFDMIGWERWDPDEHGPAPDPRAAITLRHALHMSSGLYPVDNEYGGSIGSPLCYFAGWECARFARDRGLVREPGAVWDYENHDTLLALVALRSALGDDQGHLAFPRRALLDRIGMRHTVPGVDRYGTFVMSSQVYMNARDLARLGLLYLNRGVWEGERILSEEWVDFVRTPAPSTRDFGRFYGGQWWLVPDERTELPQDAYTAAGAGGQYAIVVPSADLVVVRRGLDRGPTLSAWDLLEQVLRAIPRGRTDAEKLPIAR
jgi:CubicO group peptidase (beta-lactamase class C family)